MSAPLELTADTVQALADGSHDLAAWREQGRALAQADNARQWEVGEWLLAGEVRLGRKVYPEAAAIFRGYRHQSLKQFAYVARRVPACIRIHALSWAHHQLVARFKPEYQQGLLAQALKHNLPLSKFRSYINRHYPPKQKSKTVPLHLSENELSWLHMWALHYKVSDTEMAQRIFRDWCRHYNANEVGDPIYEQVQPNEVYGTF